MDYTSAFDAIKSVVNLLDKGQKVRDELIENANQFSTYLMLASTYALGQLNEALSENDHQNKIAILAKLSKEGIAAFSHMNHLCEKIRTNSNALSRLMTEKGRNVEMANRDEAMKIYQILEDKEWGMQNLFNALLSASTTIDELNSDELDDWIKDKVKTCCDITSEANASVRLLSQIL